MENRKVENYVDMALLLWRVWMGLYKDYMIAETNMQEVAQQVLLQNKILSDPELFLDFGIQTEVPLFEKAVLYLFKLLP